MNDRKGIDSQSGRDKAVGALPTSPVLERKGINPTSAPVESATDGGVVAAPPDTSPPGTVDHRLKFAEEAHQYIREYIRLADQKATFFFTGGTALLAFLYKDGVSARWLKPPMTWNILDMTAFVAMAALAVAAFISLLVIIPRTPGSRRGFLFWEAIAEYEAGRNYADDVAQLSSATLLQIKAEHCYDLAKVCRRKYTLLRLGLRVGAVALAASLLVFLFI